MKKAASALLLTGLLATGIASACPGGKGEHGLNRMVDRLELTSKQETQFREIMTTSFEQMKSYHEQQRAETLKQLGSVLSAEQLTEFEEITERRFHHKQGRGI